LELAQSNLDQAENKLEIASSINIFEGGLLPPIKNSLHSLSQDRDQLSNLIDTLQRSLR